MKNKNEKTPRQFQPENTILDGQNEDPSREPSTWLKGVVGLDEDTQVRQTCALEAEIFLQNYLFPIVEGEEQVTEERLSDLVVQFKRSHPGQIGELEMSQITARLLNRFQYRLIDEAESDLSPAVDSLERDLRCFTALAHLDFQRIDASVRERLHSG